MFLVDEAAGVSHQSVTESSLHASIASSTSSEQDNLTECKDSGPIMAVLSPTADNEEISHARSVVNIQLAYSKEDCVNVFQGVSVANLKRLITRYELEHQGLIERSELVNRACDAILVALKSGIDAHSLAMQQSGTGENPLAPPPSILIKPLDFVDSKALFDAIIGHDMETIDALCRQHPLLIHAVRAVDGKTPLIVAAIEKFVPAVLYFLERGAAYKHHSCAQAGFTGHHVSELCDCEQALCDLSQLGQKTGAWTPAEVMLRHRSLTDLENALGVPTTVCTGYGALPLRARTFVGTAYILNEIQNCLDERALGADLVECCCRDSAAQNERDEVTIRCRVLLDLALTFTQRMSETFICSGGITIFKRTLTAIVNTCTCITCWTITCERLHVMSITLLHIVLQLMKQLRAGDARLLEQACEDGITHLLLRLLEKCVDPVPLRFPEDDVDITLRSIAFEPHMIRTVALVCQSLTEITFNSFESDRLVDLFPEDTVIKLVNCITSTSIFCQLLEQIGTCESDVKQIITDRACAEMLAWWLTNLLGAGLFSDVKATRSWAQGIASILLRMHPGLEKAITLASSARTYGKISISRAACDGHVEALLMALESDPDAMHEPNEQGQPALIAAASTGNKSVCDCIIVLVERGGALKYHENPPNRGRRHVTKFFENEALFEELAQLSEGDTAPDPADRARIISGIRALFAPPPMTLDTFDKLLQRSRVLDAQGLTSEPPAGEQCFLCTESLVGTRGKGDVQNMQLTPCGHWHHVDCVKQWLLGNRATCPRCDVAIDFAWPDPPPAPGIDSGSKGWVPTDSVRRAIQILEHEVDQSDRCVLALRLLADLALTSLRRASRMIDLRCFDAIVVVCGEHMTDASVQHAAALVCLEVAISLKETNYHKIAIEILAVIRLTLESACSCETLVARAASASIERDRWSLVAEVSIQTLAELSISPSLPDISVFMLRLSMNSMVLSSVVKFSGYPEVIRMADILLRKVVLLNDENAIDCAAKAALILKTKLQEFNIAPESWSSLNRIAQEGSQQQGEREHSERIGVGLPAVSDHPGRGALLNPILFCRQLHYQHQLHRMAMQGGAPLPELSDDATDMYRFAAQLTMQLLAQGHHEPSADASNLDIVDSTAVENSSLRDARANEDLDLLD